MARPALADPLVTPGAREAWRRLWRHTPACVAVGLLLLLGLAALLGPWLNPNDTQSLDWQRIAAPPSLVHAHWLGTDRLGRDLFVRTLAGTRVSLAIGLVASLVSVLIGIGYGAVAGYFGGRVDHVMMRVIEIISGLPLVFFVIFVTVLFGHGASVLFLCIGAVGWLTMARIVRGQTLSVRQQDYIEAAIAGGAGSGRIILRHVVPNVLGPVVVYATLSVPQIMLFESSLSFLGLGIQEPHTSLGALVAEGAGEMQGAPWMLLCPGGCLALLLVSLNVFGDGLRDALDVREA